MWKYLFFLVVLVYPIEPLFSVSAYNKPIESHQPDGSIVTLILKGDEQLKCAQSIDGYTLICNEKNEWVYAVEDSSGLLIPSSHLASDKLKNEASIVSFLKIQPKGIRYKAQIDRKKEKMHKRLPAPSKTATAFGERKGLIILMNFSDVKFSTTNEAFDQLFNAKNYSGLSSGSVRDFFLKNSYDQFDYRFDVVGPFNALHTMSYYGANNYSGNDRCPEELIKEAVIAASTYVDFSNYDFDNDGYVDNIHVIFAGYGEEAGASTNAIWSHQWDIPESLEYNGKIISTYSCTPELRKNTGNKISPVGVHCHELAHTLGVPDFYDTDYTDNGYYEGTGDWDIMANGSWNNDGDTPAEINPYCKIYLLGWAEAKTLSDSTEVSVNAQSRENAFYRIDTQTENEFFLLENRQQKGFDASLPHHGLLIYHIHSNINYEYNDLNTTHPQKCYPVVASSTAPYPDVTPASYGNINSSGCPFPGTHEKKSFTDNTIPSAKSWSHRGSNCYITDIQEVDSIITFKFAPFPDVVSTAGDTTIICSETFDNGFPQNWSQRIISGSQMWVKLKGEGGKTTNGQTGISLSANTMSVIKSESLAITPKLDCSCSDPVFVSFSYKCLNNAGVSVYYSMDPYTDWLKIDSYEKTDSWRSVTLALPNTATSIHLGFLGSCIVNSTIYLDNVSVFSVKKIQTKIGTEKNDKKEFQWFLKDSRICIETATSGQLYLYDIQGRLVRKVLMQDGLNNIALPPGTYLYRFNNKNGLFIIP